MTVDRAAAVAGRGAPGVPALHDAGVAVALADAGDIDALALFEDVGLQDVAHVQGGAVLKAELVQVLHHAHAGLLKVALLRLGELLGGDFAVAELDGVVAFLVRRLLLDDDAGTGLYYGDRNDLARLIEDLRHADLLADDGFLHVYFLLTVIG